MCSKKLIKAFLVLVFLAAVGWSLASCDTTPPVDLAPIQTQIAQLEDDVSELRAVGQQDRAVIANLGDLIQILEGRADQNLASINTLVEMVQTVLETTEGLPVAYVIYGSDGRLMNDGAIQPVRSHVINGQWILEFHIANFDVVNNADYFHIVPTDPMPTGWVASGVGTCFADSANRDSQATGSAIWKRYDFSGNQWGLICAWNATHGYALNLWGKGGSLRINAFANGTGTEWIITVPWD